MKKEKVYDLEERTYQFAKDCRILVRNLPRTISNLEDAKQLGKSSGSVVANYKEANEKLGHKDLIMRLRIARKEAKEVAFWLRLLKDLNPNYSEQIKPLIQEANELRRIISSILNRIANKVSEPSF